MSGKSSNKAFESGVNKLGKAEEAFNRTEASQRHNEERYRSLLEAVNDWIWEVDQKGTYTYASTGVKHLLGYEPDEIIGRTPIDFLYSKEAKSFSRIYNNLFASKKSFKAYETGIRHKGGREVHMEASGAPIFDSDGRFSGFRGIARDVTEQKKTLADKEKLETQLRQAQKMEAIGTLAGGIAHDFNNILFPIFGYAEMALEDVPEDSISKKYLSEVFRAANRAKDLVQQILTFSRQSSQERKPLDVQMIVKEALKLLRASLPAMIEIRQDIDRDCSPILADPTEIHQVMMNLCTNAYHAMRETGGILHIKLGEVEIDHVNYSLHGTTRPGKYLRLTVSDTGQGIEKEAIERIFNPYFTTKLPGEGTGLGLAVVHGIMKSCGGHITVHSESGQGATFHSYFPCVDRCPAEVENVKEESSPPGGSEHILLVEDETQILQMQKRMLEGLGYRITAKLDSLEAFETFCLHPDKFDLVVTDLIMPQMKGTQLARKITGIRPDIPVILCTGIGSEIEESSIRECVMKPLVMSNMARKIRHVLDQEKDG
ncbi:PAS domain S-box protein [Thermodesulfobacteriota bacterium]